MLLFTLFLVCFLHSWPIKLILILLLRHLEKLGHWDYSKFTGSTVNSLLNEVCLIRWNFAIRFVWNVDFTGIITVFKSIKYRVRTLWPPQSVCKIKEHGGFHSFAQTLTRLSCSEKPAPIKSDKIRPLIPHWTTHFVLSEFQIQMSELIPSVGCDSLFTFISSRLVCRAKELIQINTEKNTNLWAVEFFFA